MLRAALAELWEGIVKMAEKELESPPEKMAVYNRENAREGALWIRWVKPLDFLSRLSVAAAAVADAAADAAADATIVDVVVVVLSVYFVITLGLAAFEADVCAMGPPISRPACVEQHGRSTSETKFAHLHVRDVMV